MPRTSEQNKKIKDERRNDILSVSVRLFATKGYKNVTVDDIADEVGCSHGLFYHYFSDKKDIYMALKKNMESEEYAKYRIPVEEMKKAGGYNGLKILCEHSLYTMDAPDDVIYYGRMLANERYTFLALKGETKAQEVMDLIIELIKQGQKEGKVRDDDPSIIAQMFLDFCDGAMKRRTRDGSKRFTRIPAKDILRIFDK